MNPKDQAPATAADIEAILRRALDYPYRAPPHSYLYDAAATDHWRPLPRDPSLLEGRTPVLASGSNRAPERLAQKFRAAFPAARIPVTRAYLAGFDSVYCAHVTSYGSIPATLHPSNGTTVALHVTWLKDDELLCMHETEQPGVNYHFVRMGDVDLALEDGTRLDGAYAYLSAHGAMLDEGAPIALAAVEAHGRRFRHRDQVAMLAALSERVAPDEALHDFIASMVGAGMARERLRAECERLMRRAVEPFPFEAVEIIPVGA